MSEENQNQQSPVRNQAAARINRAGQRPTTRRVAGMRNDETMPSSHRNEGAAPNPQILMKRYCPVYVIRSTGITECTMCRNQLDQVCTICQSEGITDTNRCTVVEGRCGHKFHRHCLEGWLRRSPYCPSGSCGLRWENA